MEKIYGIYPGNLTEEQIENINNFTEEELFILISKLEKEYESKMRYSKIKNTEEIEELRFALEYTIFKANKYKLNIPTPEAGKHIKETLDYLLWFKKWHIELKKDSKKRK